MNTTDLVIRICEDADTPISLSVAILARYGEWDQIATKATDPGNYTSARRYLLDTIAVDSNRKNSSLSTSFNKKKTALENFYRSEQTCRETNKRLCQHEPELLFGVGSTPLGRFVREVQMKVQSVIGRDPDLHRIWVNSGFGPGSTFKDVGQLSTVADKMTTVPTCTDSRVISLFPFEETAWFRARPSWRHEICEFVRGNRFTTVPKDGKTDRGICIEPSVNLYIQKGIGSLLRSRLKHRAGIDLERGQEPQRRMALEGSLTGAIATIDLSNASDTVSKKLVQLLLPVKWYELLKLLRSPETYVEGKWVLNQKFSSMGNGYTFELESLLFWAIADTTCERLGFRNTTSVYGDDIIVPVSCYDAVLAFLKYLGFSPNLKKSFNAGFFRESCGGDFWDGKDVRAIFIKETPTQPSDLITLANQINHLNGNVLVRDQFSKTRDWIIDQIPSHVRRCRGPAILGDIVIHDDNVSSWDSKWRDGIRYLRCWKPISKWVGLEHFRPDVQFASVLYGVARSSSGVPTRGVAGHHIKWVAFS